MAPLAGCGSGSEAESPRGLTYRGVTYEVADRGWPETSWQATRMVDDMRVISDELHANSVTVFGDGVERMSATASEAAERGLHVWLQPRLADVSHREILDHLEQMANSVAMFQLDLADADFHAERLRGARAVRARIARDLSAALAAGELRSGTDVTTLAKLVETTYHGAMIGWAIHRENTLANWMREQVTVVLAPHQTAS